MANTRENRVVTRLGFEESGADVRARYRKSIEDIRKPAQQAREEIEKLANADFSKADSGIRKISASLTGLSNTVSTATSKIATFRREFDGIKSKTVNLHVNSNPVPNLSRSVFTPSSPVAHPNVMRNTGLQNSGISGMVNGFKQVEQSIKRVMTELRHNIQQIVGLIDKIKLKFTATINASQYFITLRRMIRAAEIAGKRIRRELNINSGGGGGSGNGGGGNGGHGGGNGGGNGNGEGEGNSSMGKFASNVGAFIGGVSLIKEAMSLRDTYVSSMRTLEYITGDINKAKDAQQQLLQVSKETHSSYEGTRDLFVSFQSIADKTKLSLKENVELTKTVQIASKMGGGTQTELAITQLEQAIKKGKMDQQDLHSIEMFSPGITGALAKGLDISIADLRDKVHKGLKAEDIIKALQKVGPELAKMNAEADLTFDNVSHYAETTLLQIVGKITEAADGFGIFYKAMIKAIDYLKAGFDSLFGTLTNWLGGADRAAQMFQTALVSLGGGAVIAALIAFGTALATALWPVAAATAAVFALIESFMMLKDWVNGEDGLLTSWFGDFSKVKEVLQPIFDFWIRMWNVCKDVFMSVGKDVIGTLLSIAEILYNTIKQAIEAVMDVAVAITSAIGDLFGIGGDTPLEKALNTVGALITVLGETLKSFFGILQNLFSFLRDLLMGDMDEVWRKMELGFLIFVESVKNGFKVIFESIEIALMKSVHAVRKLLPAWLGGYDNKEGEAEAQKKIEDKTAERNANANKSSDDIAQDVKASRRDLWSKEDVEKHDATDPRFASKLDQLVAIEREQKKLAEEQRNSKTSDQRLAQIDYRMNDLNNQSNALAKSINEQRKADVGGGKIDSLQGVVDRRAQMLDDTKAKNDEANAAQEEQKAKALEDADPVRVAQRQRLESFKVGQDSLGEKAAGMGVGGSNTTNNNINAPNNITNHVTVNAVSNDPAGVGREVANAVGETSSSKSGIGVLAPLEATGR